MALEEAERQKPPKMLTEAQKETIKRTWKIIETNVARVGVVTFIGLFETHPDVQEVFIPFRGLPMEEVQQSKELRSHALRVMGFVEKAVRRLEEPEKLVPLIQECGKNHCHYGAQIQHVELVGPEFLKAIQPALESEWTDEVEEAWDLLMKNIAYGMRLAMIEEIKKG
ncbi:cytoglobin-2-like [Macrobrachium nipponense]|uniref:cytoglobin-2-like n=1 Tax=Macrobrachium nipponense TaxID=159736 RepID=UPI0030C8057B